MESMESEVVGFEFPLFGESLFRASGKGDSYRLGGGLRV
jgi:hypothetical protein